MDMFSRQSKFIVASGFVALMLIMITVTTIGYSHMIGNTERMEAVVASQNRKIDLVITMYSVVRERAVLLFSMANTADPFERDQMFVRFTELAGTYILARDELHELAVEPAELALTGEVTRDVFAASPLQVQVTDLLLDGQLRAAGDLLHDKAIPAQNNVMARLRDLLDFEQRSTNRKIEQAREDFKNTLGLLIALIVLAAAIGVVIAIIVTTKVGRASDVLFADAALQSIAESVVILDTDGRILYLNNTALDLMNLDRTDLLGRTASGIMPCLPGLDSITDGSRRGECKYPVADGNTRDLEYSVSLIRSRNDRKLGFVIALRDVTDRRAMEQQVLKSRERLSLVMRGTNDGIWDYNLETGEIYFSPRWKSMLGYAPEDVADSFAAWQELIYPADLGKALLAWTDCMTGAVDAFSVELRMRAADGEWRWIECRGLAQFDASTAPVRLAGSHTDITDRKNAEQALFAAKEHAEVTLESIGDAVITLDRQGLVTYMNRVAETLSDWPADEALGRRFGSIFKLYDEDSRNPVDGTLPGFARRRDAVTRYDRLIMINRSGIEYGVEQIMAPIRDRKGDITGTVTVLRDVSKERELQRQLFWQATHDSLTGLVNRSDFERRLGALLNDVRQSSNQHALLYMDLDQFKVVNDTCGHIAGDELLRQLGTVLQHRIRATDTLARLGGDEFGVLLQDCSLSHALEIAGALRENVADFRFARDGKTFALGVSIGVVPIDSDSGSKDEVMTAADIACYAAKDLGRNRVHLYRPGDDALATRHGEIQWVARITRSLQENRLILYRQAIAGLNEDCRDTTHYEVLIRLLDETGECIPPGAFIPAAERYNLMPSIDRWVIRNLFAHLAGARARMEREAAGHGNCRSLYTINLSGNSINDPEFLRFVQDQFEQSGLPARNFCFEITETSAIANLSNASTFIRELKQLGCLFALDDFGSGLSSFGYLKNLPVDFLKIDGQFTRDMAHDPIDLAMVRSINEIGHVMNIRTIAEFVENRETLDLLREIGVDFAQGYYIDVPKPLDETDITARKQDAV